MRPTPSSAIPLRLSSYPRAIPLPLLWAPTTSTRIEMLDQNPITSATMAGSMAHVPIRLAEFVGALSVATDLSVGCPMESALRASLIATRLGAELGCSQEDLHDVYYTALLRLLGCTGASHEEAWRFGGGDDVALRRAFLKTDLGDVGAVLGTAVSQLGRGTGVVSRARSVGRFLKKEEGGASLPNAHCVQAITLARDLKMAVGVQQGLAEMYERFDGRGLPGRARGTELALAARLMHVAYVAEMERITNGAAAAARVVKKRAGGQLDPDIAALFIKRAPEILDGLQAASVWDTFLLAEPSPQGVIAEAALPDFAHAFACFVDVKSPYRLGHSIGVANLAEQAAIEAGLPAAERQQLRLAGLLHDLGIVSVPNGIWDKCGPLNPVEWERVRLHAYHSERVLSLSPALRPVANLVGRHHERADGSGYHRGLNGSLGMASALLAACDVYQSMREDRAHRPALSREDAADGLREEGRRGRLDANAVEVVLKSAGHRPQRKQPSGGPSGLSSREVEVLRLLSRGLSDKEIAQQLSLSARTVHHHVEHIYEKTGVTGRAAAALYAVRHDLISPE